MVMVQDAPFVKAVLLAEGKPIKAMSIDIHIAALLRRGLRFRLGYWLFQLALRIWRLRYLEVLHQNEEIL